jgi:hypothetical protein
MMSKIDFDSANQFEDLVAQVYMYCENTDPNGLYPSGDIDLVEFAARFIAVWEARR